MSATKDSFPVMCRLCASEPMHVASGLLFCTPLCPLADLMHSVKRWNDLNAAIDEKFAALAARVEELEGALVEARHWLHPGKPSPMTAVLVIDQALARARKEQAPCIVCDGPSNGLTDSNDIGPYCEHCHGLVTEEEQAPIVNVEESIVNVRAPEPATNMDGLEGRRLDIVGLDPDRPGDIYAPAPSKEGGSDD